jgi:synaptic vesicle membrane protein VAT-1
MHYTRSLILASARTPGYDCVMKQVLISRAGLPEVLQLRQVPNLTPRNGEVRLRVEACGVTFRDLLGRMGLDRDAPPLPFVPGWAVAGHIEAISQGVPDFKEGDNVIALTHYGGYSDQICVPYQQVFKRFDWMTAQDGAALPVSYLLAYLMLVIMGSVQPGDRVLVHGAGGAVGSAALDICKIMGVEVFGTASPAKHAFLRERGVQHPIDYRNMDYEQVINDLTGGRGVQLILDPLGGRHWQKNYRLLTPMGRLIYFGLSSLAPEPVRSRWAWWRGLVTIPFYTPLRLMDENRGVMGVNLSALLRAGALQRAWMQRLLSWYDEALFRPHIDRTYSLEQAAEAHHYIQTRQNVGQVLLLS